MPRTILAFGEILWDVFPDNTRKLGGAPLNFAYRAASLGENVAFVSRLGRDFIGRKAHELAAELSMDTGWLQWDEVYPTGTVDVSFDHNHQPDYVINTDVAYDHIQMMDSLRAQAARADCVCFGTIVQRAERSRQTLRAILAACPDALKVYDINLRRECFSHETVQYSLEQADVLKINDDEVRVVTDMFGLRADTPTAFCRQAGETFDIATCVVTLGDRGVLGWSREEGYVYEPGLVVELADSLGSGDSCTAGVVHALLDGAGLRRACALGNALGAAVASHVGGTPEVHPEEALALQSSARGRTVDERFADLVAH
jgi:fructokinase